MCGYRFYIVAFTFFDEEKPVIQRGCFYPESLNVELQFFIIQVNGSYQFLGIEFLNHYYIFRIETLSQLCIRDFIVTVVVKNKDLFFRIKAAKEYTFLFSVQSAELIIEP